VHIARLRAKLAGLAVEIDTVRGTGYRLTAHADAGSES
jgi:DNA-binding response OmpR family regulator